MPIGKQHIIRFSEDSTGALSLDDVQRVDFNHNSGFVTTTSVQKEDFTGSPNDAFVVKISYPTGSVPAMSTTLTTILQTAKDAVNNAFGNGEAGAPT